MEQSGTRNLGQIAAIWVSADAPNNTKLIWYDSNQQKHKVYDTANNQWTALNPQVVTSTDIESLRRHIVDEHGYLTIGDFYYLTDVGTLAIAITITKIWYVDSMNNYVIDDLDSHISNAITSINFDNLLIDGSKGVFQDGQLRFDFTTVTTGSEMQTVNDHIVIRRKNGNVWSWIKAKLSGFISAITGNSITWNNGFYFNFNSELNAKKNVVGGVVSWEKRSEDMNTLQNNINNVARNFAITLQAAEDYTDSKTNKQYLYEDMKPNLQWSALQNPPNIPGADSNLEDILNILLSWVQLLKISNNIKIGNGFIPGGRSGNVNYNDTVKTAIEKLINQINLGRNSDNLNLPSDWDERTYSGDVANKDTLSVAIGKIVKAIADWNNDIWGREVPMAFVETGILGQKIGENNFASVTYNATDSWKYGYKNGNLLLECVKNNYSMNVPDLINGFSSGMAIEDATNYIGASVGLIRNPYIVEQLNKTLQKSNVPISISAPAYFHYDADEGVEDVWGIARVALYPLDTTGRLFINGEIVKDGWIVMLQGGNYGMNKDEKGVWKFDNRGGGSWDGSRSTYFCWVCRLAIPINVFI